MEVISWSRGRVRKLKFTGEALMVHSKSLMQTGVSYVWTGGGNKRRPVRLEFTEERELAGPEHASSSKQSLGLGGFV